MIMSNWPVTLARAAKWALAIKEARYYSVYKFKVIIKVANQTVWMYKLVAPLILIEFLMRLDFQSMETVLCLVQVFAALL